MATIAVYVNATKDETRAIENRARAVAHDLGYVVSLGARMGDGHLGELLAAIANGEVEVRKARGEGDGRKDR
jgi:hypothetical protein